MSSASRPSTPAPPNTISHPAYNLLTKAHDADTASSIFIDKLRNKPLLLHPSHTSTAPQDKRALRRHVRLRKKQYHLQHQKPRPLSAKEKRQLGLHHLDPTKVKYATYQKLNHMWTGYILEVLNLLDTKTGSVSSEVLTGARTIQASISGSLIASADFHGMAIEVVRAKDVGRVGLKGIIVRETRSTFTVVTPDDRCVCIMKSGCIFHVAIDLAAYAAALTETAAPQLPDQETSMAQLPSRPDRHTIKPIVLELHGSQLEVRPVERAVRKFKWKSMDYL